MQAPPSKPRQLCKPQGQAQRGLQQGFVAVLFLVMLAVAAIAATTLSILGKAKDSNLAKQYKTQTALKQAKDALLSYVIANGRLPCPADIRTVNIAISNEGTVDSSYCLGQGIGVIGLLPWKGLGLPLLEDGTDNCLWYAVSGHIKSANKSYPVNADTDGAFKVIEPQGTLLAGAAGTTSSNAMAVIIAPNTPTQSDGFTQNRTAPATSTRQYCSLPAGANNVAIATHFMDTATITVGGTPTKYDNWDISTTKVLPAVPATVKTFIQGYKNGTYPINGLNDQLTWITPDEFAKAITQFATNSAAKSLSNFYRPDDATAVNIYQGNLYYPSPASAFGACQQGGTMGALPNSCAVNLLNPWNDYYISGFGDFTNKTDKDKFDHSLGELINPAGGDNWASKITYQVSPKCVPPATNCNGAGSLLTHNNQTNLHTIVTATGRSGSTFTATSYTK
jgi:hypothetical protein